MKILITLVVIILLQNEANATAPCRTTNPELIACEGGEKIAQIIDSNGCLIWTCIPDQPHCCPRIAPSATLCLGESSDLDQVMDPVTGCKIWTCVPRQPRCCKPTSPIQKCKENFYSGQVYDMKTACPIWTCVPCPSIEGEGERITCPNGDPIQNIGHNGCPFWTCPTYTTLNA